LQVAKAKFDHLSETPSEDPWTHLQQTRVLESAFQSLSSTEPDLPTSDSPLPALLAIRSTHNTITQTKESIKTLDSQCRREAASLKREQENLRDSNLITEAMEKRFHALRSRKLENSKKSSGQAARDLIRELKRRARVYEEDTQNLVISFNRFIDDHLASMLAAEELGGPVVGDIIDVEDGILEAGFSNQGKVRKPRSDHNTNASQKRIDEIWGRANGSGAGKISAREAAGTEIRSLTEELLNTSASDGSAGTGAYVTLPRDSAAARFLIRAKVAQFHPRDARRIRLIDFGRDLED
jgi:hypothetical protein